MSGYYVNISLVEEVHEKVLRYLPVMSRPLNMIGEKSEPLWSALYVDLADRKLSNWLWNKYEGNRQHDVMVKFGREEVVRLKLMYVNAFHFMNLDTHVSFIINYSLVN